MEHLKKALPVSVPPEAALSSAGLVGSTRQGGHSPVGRGLPWTLSLRGGSIWGQYSGHNPCLSFPLQQGPASAFLLCRGRGGCSALCPGLVASGRSWGNLCPPTTPLHPWQGKAAPMFQWLLSAFLCLCWQRVTPWPCCPPCHSYPRTPLLHWGWGHSSPEGSSVLPSPCPGTRGYQS